MDEQSDEPKRRIGRFLKSTIFCRRWVIGGVRPDMVMITRNQAEAIAARYVATLTQSCELNGFELELVRDATEEFDFGWLFYYNSSDPDRVPIAGNAPLIVERESGRIVPTGTAYPVQHYIDNYRTTGDPYGCLGHGVRLSGYNDGARKIDATKAIREHLGIGLGDAKQIVENCLNGASVVLTSKSDEDAVLLESKLKAALFVAERIPASEGRTKP